MDTLGRYYLNNQFLFSGPRSAFSCLNANPTSNQNRGLLSQVENVPFPMLLSSSAFHLYRHWFCAGWAWESWPNQDLWGIIKMDWKCLEHLESLWPRTEGDSSTLHCSGIDFNPSRPSHRGVCKCRNGDSCGYMCWDIIESHRLEVVGGKGLISAKKNIKGKMSIWKNAVTAVPKRHRYIPGLYVAIHQYKCSA